MKITYKISELKNIAIKIKSLFKTPKTLLFYGEMGVGKTTLIKELAKQLGVTEKTSSPTFSLVNEYKTEDCTIYHFDFYRINQEEEVYDIGIEDYFHTNAWCFVEWPEKIPNLIPENAIIIKLTKTAEETRQVEFYNP